MIKKMIFWTLGLVALTAQSAELEDSRFSLVGSISQQVGKKKIGIVLLKDGQTKKTIPVEIGKVFKVGSEIFHVVSVVEGGAVVSDGKNLHQIGKAAATASYGNKPRVRPSSNNVPAKFRVNSQNRSTFKKARLISPRKQKREYKALEEQQRRTRQIQAEIEEEQAEYEREQYKKKQDAAARMTNEEVERADQELMERTNTEQAFDVQEGDSDDFEEDLNEAIDEQNLDSTGVGDMSNQ